MGIESVSSVVVTTPAPAVQSGDGKLPSGPRRPGEPYGKYLRRINMDELKRERTTQQREYAKYGKRWDDYGSDCAQKGEPAYPTYLRLQAIAAESRRRAAGR